MVKDLNKTARKGANKRCPFSNQCGKVCEHVNSELGCDYYKWNACGDDIIEDQERIREIMEKAKIREMEEAMIEEMEDAGGLVMLSVDLLFPHPDNPRKKLGDLKELSESIKAKGVMQNLTVVPKKDDQGKYTIIIGHRRHAAAKKAGLREVPCVIVNMSEQDQLATMLLENIQRSDLTAYEQAMGFQMMMDFGDSVAGIVEKTGFSETTVRRRLKMAELDHEVLQKVSGRQISFGDIDKLSQIEDVKVRNKVLADIGTANFNSSLKTAVADQKRAETLKTMREAFDAAGLVEITDAEYNKYHYITSTTDRSLDNIEKEIERAKERGATGYYYGYSTIFYMMCKKEDADKAPKKSEADLQREREEREREEKIDRLTEAFQKAYELRRDFIDSYSLKQAVINLDKIAAFFACMSANEDINYGINKEDFEKLLFGRECEVSSYEEMQGMIESSSAAKAMLVAVWLITDDENDDCCDYYGGFDENERLNMVYEFLESIGYEMSDEERELISGESELYRKEAE